MERDSYLQHLAETVDEIAKPTLWLGWYLVPPPRQQEEVPECIEKRLRPAAFVSQTLSLPPLDLSLCGTLMAFSEQGTEIRPKIQVMEAEAVCGNEKAAGACERARCANLNVTQLLVAERLGYRRQQDLLVRAVDQRFAVIRERKRDHTSARDPTVHAAKCDAIL